MKGNFFQVERADEPSFGSTRQGPACCGNAIYMITMVTPMLREFAQQLLDYETAAPPVRGDAAVRVCEKLRHSLSTLVGVAGFRSLLARALTLAKAEGPERCRRTGSHVDRRSARRHQNRPRKNVAAPGGHRHPPTPFQSLGHCGRRYHTKAPES